MLIGKTYEASYIIAIRNSWYLFRVSESENKGQLCSNCLLSLDNSLSLFSVLREY